MSIQLKSAHLTRQMDLIPLDVLGECITIVGAGAIGSFTALALAKMGLENLAVYDFDNIELENMSSQFYPYSAIGSPKVLALKDMIWQFANVRIDARNERYEKGRFPGIVISAVDNMAVRKLLWDNHKRMAPATKLFIDCRMAAEFGLVYAMDPMNPKDIDSYEKTLYTDENALQERCTGKATSYSAIMLSGFVAKVVKDLLTKSTPYARVTQWNIGKNVCESYPVKR